MQSLPANIYSVAAVREMDRFAVQDKGVPGYTLMQRAAAAAIREAQLRFPDARRWQVICGPGNNGGDGYVVARLATLRGISASVVTLVDPATLRGDAATAYTDYAASDGVVMPWTGKLDTEAELLVDAILGSGLQRDVAGIFEAAVTAINAHPADVHALDIATGINGDTGQLMGAAITADLTTAFGGLNAGLFLCEGPRHCGHITFDDLEIGRDASTVPLYKRLDDELLATALPPRSRDSHKGDFGHVLVVGGGPGMPGAAQLCGEAALRAGAGRVSLATHAQHAALIAVQRPELMSYAVEVAGDLATLLETADVVAFGPGLGRSEWARMMFETVLEYDPLAVWDADALNWLADTPTTSARRILTPHPGEAATLLGSSSAAVQANRPAALSALVEKYGDIVVLKGAGTLISSAEDAPFICTAGNPGMAAAGMGDVLTGVISAMLAQGQSLITAATVGVVLHAQAGDIAANNGERGMLASDVVDVLRHVGNP